MLYIYVNLVLDGTKARTIFLQCTLQAMWIQRPTASDANAQIMTDDIEHEGKLSEWMSASNYCLPHFN